MSNHRLSWARRHPRAVLLLAGLFVALAAVAGGGVHEVLRSGGTTDEASESALVDRVVEESAPGLAPNLLVLVDTPGGADTPEAQAAATALTGVLAAEASVTGVSSYADGRADLVSADGDHALVTARLRGEESEIATTMDELRPALEEAQAGLGVEITGSAVARETMDKIIAEDLLRAEIIALPIMFVILLLAFGGFWAASIPLAIGVFAIMTTNAALRGIGEVTDVSVFALNLTTALGLGLAVDYALLIVRRYREEIALGAEHQDALSRTMSTAGRTVAFSGITVAAALSALLVFPLYFLRSFAYAGVVVVAASMVGALVVTPAALTLLRRRLARPSRFGRRGRTAAAVPSAVTGEITGEVTGRWADLAAWVYRHARWVAPVSVVALLVMAVPFGSVRFGTSDERQLPADNGVRVAQETIRGDFPLAQQPLATVVPDETGSVTSLAESLRALPDVEAVREVPSQAGTLLTVHSALDPMSGQARDLVQQLRTVAGSASVGGPSASLVDTQQAIGDRLLLALAIVLLTSLLLVFLLSGSILLPLISVVTNGLSLTAMFGAIVWVFQDGHLAETLGFTPTGYIDVTLPALMACVAFALSMDYGVFVVARFVEEHQTGATMRQTLLRSLQRTGGVITAAAVILATVLLAIGSSSITNTKMLGLGVTLAVLVDATLVRCIVVPALLALLGRATWWAPAPLTAFHARWGWREDAPAPGATSGAVPSTSTEPAPVPVG